jgi:hypothetical protein
MLAGGTVSFGYEWFFFGFMMSFLGSALGLTIILGMNWDKAMEYWGKIADVLDKAGSIKDIQARHEILKSMGYNVPPASVQIMETRRNEDGVFEGQSLKRVPVSSVILQLMADKVLMTGNNDFPTEQSELGKAIPNYRKVKEYLKKEGYIVPKNNRNKRGGYLFNRKGTQVLYQYASEGIKLELERKVIGEYDKESERQATT